VAPLKHVAEISGRVGWHGLSTDDYLTEGEFLVTGTDLRDGTVSWASCHRVSEARWKQDPRIQLEHGDVLITKDGTIGKIALVGDLPGRATLNSGVFRVRPSRELLGVFLFRVLESRIFTDFVDLLGHGSTINHLYERDVVNFRIPLPSISVQRTIADYLDRETARIDALITKKQQMIELFKERRQVLITSAVTDRSSSQGRGVNDRGWWTGQACAPWQIGRLKDLVEVTNGFPFDASRFNDVDGTPLIRIRDLLRGYTETYFDGPIPATAIVEDGDLLVGMDGDFNSGVWTGGRAALNQRMCRLRARTGLDRRFLWYLIDLPLRYINDLTYSTTVKHLSSTDLLNERIPLPPIARQRIIADYLDRETARIDAITATAEQQIALMRERRQALITAAVTGELEVSGVAA
jgi:type I restriction enzyme S subunit